MPEVVVVRAGMVVVLVVSNTFTVTDLLRPPFWVVTLMVAVPGLRAVILPEELTLATELLLEVQVTALLAVLGSMVGVKVMVSFSPNRRLLVFRLMEVGTLGSYTSSFKLPLILLLRLEYA